MMNRTDRENLSALSDATVRPSPIGLNTATGAPELGELGIPASHHLTATVADNVTVANGSMIEPKPGSKFAMPEENFGTVPVGQMNSYGDYTGTGMSPQPSRPQQTQILPKPGSKFALPPEEDEFGSIPAPLAVGSDSADRDEPDSCMVAQAETQAFHAPAAAYQPPLQATPPVASRASVSDDTTLPNGSYLITAKPGSKFSAGHPRK